MSGDRLDSEAAAPLRAERLSKAGSAQGSLANLLPVLEEEKRGESAQNGFVEAGSSADAETSLLGARSSSATALLEEKGQPTTPRSRSPSDLSFLDEASDLDEALFAPLGVYKEASSGASPGEIRTAVLEWMYEEKDEESCPELSLPNAGVLEDLISVFVSVVLHGKSDVIRMQVWRFLIQGSVNSLHFAFLVICNLNASCHSAKGADEEDPVSEAYKKKRAKDIAAIERIIDVVKKETISRVENLEKSAEYSVETPASPVLSSLRYSLDNIINQLEDVHDNQVLTNLDLNVRGRTTRQNIDLLVQKVRNAILRHNSNNDGEQSLAELDGKIGFIKTLTDLDEWLRTSIIRDQRATVLEDKLRSLAHALPLGAYFPTAVDRATRKHRVLRLVLEETIVFNTAKKCPFLLVAEVEPIINSSVDDPDLGSEGEFQEERGSRRKSALQALEMVSTKDFWKNPIKEIKHFKERAKSEAGFGNNVFEMRSPSSASHNVYDMGVDVEEDEALNGSSGAKSFKDQEKWEDMQERIRKTSPYGERPHWQLSSMFVKSGDDLRQQQLGVLFVSTFQKIFLEERVPVWLAPYKVIATGRICGLLEPARNADSIARIKERGGYDGIDMYFLDRFGPKNSNSYKRAQRNFLQSLAGYSIVAYLIKLHDRHNGNILIDTDGHLLHIDFGFMLGFSHKLERSPFKLTPDMIEILGGPYSKTFQDFRRLMEKAYIAANKHHKEIILLAELMSIDESSSECFAGGRRWVIDEFRARFNPGLTTRKLKVHINDIIDWSLGNYTTRCYDRYQRCVNGIW